MYKILTLLTGLVGLSVVALAAPAAAQGTIESLRGPVPINQINRAPNVEKQNTGEDRFMRSYRQQPPMIPHEIDGYQIDLKANRCMRCHDWPYNVEEGAPKISETHYVDRSGVALDRVSGTRWFCTQCHVPQANAKALVPNEFKSAIDVR